MAFCPQCGRQISDDASFCPSCGATVIQAGTGTTGVTPPAPPGPSFGSPPSPPAAQPPAGIPPTYAPVTLPPPPRKQKMGSGWKIALVIILVVLLAIGAGVTVLAIFVVKTVKAPVDVTNRYIEAINEDNAQEAWSLLHSDSRFRREYSLGSFEKELVRPNAHTLSTWNAHEVNVSGSSAEVKVDVELITGDKYTLTFDLKKDGGDWLILDYTYSY